mmetsp:Transcript_33264/g.93260  ORF Transcript_33264/g.93260 Transcript_33264/m.93260 type:complete len:258 (+) Transcript_33264:744-1517(+)
MEQERQGRERRGRRARRRARRGRPAAARPAAAALRGVAQGGLLEAEQGPGGYQRALRAAQPGRQRHQGAQEGHARHADAQEPGAAGRGCRQGTAQEGGREAEAQVRRGRQEDGPQGPGAGGQQVGHRVPQRQPGNLHPRGRDRDEALGVYLQVRAVHHQHPEQGELCHYGHLQAHRCRLQGRHLRLRDCQQRQCEGAGAGQDPQLRHRQVLLYPGHPLQGIPRRPGGHVQVRLRQRHVPQGRRLRGAPHCGAVCFHH